MRLHSFVKVGSVLALALGIAITVSSLQAISESSAGSQFTPALDSFDSQVTLSSQLKPNKGELIGSLEIPRLNKVISIFE